MMLELLVMLLIRVLEVCELLGLVVSGVRGAII
jgi:hypothetical protein